MQWPSPFTKNPHKAMLLLNPGLVDSINNHYGVYHIGDV